MDDELGTLYQLNDYRKGVREANEMPGPPFTFVVGEQAGKAVAEAARKAKVTPGELMARALMFVVEDISLQEEGYHGPIYRKPAQRTGRLGRWLIQAGLKEQEQLIVRLSNSKSENQT